MSTDIAEAPPEGDYSGGAEEGHSQAAFDTRENKPPGANSQEDSAPAPAFDPDAIWAHVQTLFALAQGTHGKFVVLVLTGDASDPPYKIGHFFADGGEREMLHMWRFILAFDPARGLHPDGVVRKPWKMPNGKLKTYPPDYRKKPLNIYIPFALFHPDLERWRKGSEADVIASLAGVVDLDCDKGDSADLPVKASGRLETSPGNFQDFFVWPQPLSFAAAKPVLLALHRLTHKNENPNEKGDSATRDASHVWRIAGTFNWPNAAKIARGRDPKPFMVRWVYKDGARIEPQGIIDAAPPPPVKPPRPAAPPLLCHAYEERKLQSALEVLHPDVLPKVNPPGGLYAFWLEIGMAIHAFDSGEIGLELFDGFSQKSDHYDREELEAKFEYTFDGVRQDNRKRTIASVYMWAKEKDWEQPRRGDWVTEQILAGPEADAVEILCRCAKELRLTAVENKRLAQLAG